MEVDPFGEIFVKCHPFGVKRPLDSSVFSPGSVRDIVESQGPEEAVGALVHRAGVSC